jgi:hypothetical protein
MREGVIPIPHITHSKTPLKFFLHPPHNTLEGVIEVLLQCFLVDVLEQLLLREDAVKLHRGVLCES